MDVRMINAILMIGSIITELMMIKFYTGKKRIPIKNNRLVVRMFKMAIVVSILNLISLLIGMIGTSSFLINLHYYASIIFIVVYELSFLLIGDYILLNCKKLKVKWAGTIKEVYIASFVIIATLIVLHFSKGIFYIDALNEFNFGEHYFIVDAFPLIVIITSIIRFYKSNHDHMGTRNKSIMYCLIILLAGILSDNIIDGVVMVDFFFALSIVILYVGAEDPEYFISDTIRCFNEHAFEVYVDELLKEDKEFYVYGVEIRNMDLIYSRRGNKALFEALKECAKWIESLAPNAYLFYTDNSCFNIVSFEKKTDIQHEAYEHYVNNSFNSIDESMYLFLRAIKVDTSDERCISATRILKGETFAIQNCSDKTRILEVDKDVYKRIERDQYILDIMEDCKVNDSLKVYIQPLYNTIDGCIDSGEVLSRLVDSKDQIIMPFEFIPLAEKSGLISQMSYHLFEKTCEFIKENQVEDKGIRFININCSPLQFHDLQLSDKLKEIADRYEVDFSMFHFEVTETYIFNSEMMEIHIQKFKEYGASIAMDDFGKGSSNLSRLKEIDFEVAKIDMSIVWSYFEHKDTILEDVVEMFKKADLTIVAEGVETDEMARTLKDMGVDYLQGYYFAKPLPANEFLNFIREFNASQNDETRLIYKKPVDSDILVDRYIPSDSSLQYIPCGMHVCNLKEPYTLETASHSLCKMLGYTKEEFNEYTHDDYSKNIYKDDRAAFESFIDRLAKNHECDTLIYRMVRKDGSIIHVIDTMDVIVDELNVPHGYSSVTDITELVEYDNNLLNQMNKYKRMYEQTLQTNRRYERYLDFSNNCMIEFDMKTKHYIPDNKTEEVLMYPTEDSFHNMVAEKRFDQETGEHYGDMIYLVHKDDLEHVKKELDELKRGKVVNFEVRIFCGDRKYHWMEAEFHLLKDVHCMIGSFKNIDALKAE